MKRTLALIAAVTFAAAASHAQQTPAELATAAAETWLKIVDEGAYPEAYAKASEKSRKASNEEDFSRQLRIHRRNRGDFKSRTPLAVEKMPGNNVADGKKLDIMMVRFNTEWSESQAVETVSVVNEDDGWRVFGYGVARGTGRPKEPAGADKKEKAKKEKKDKKDQDKKD